ncbi:MAG: gliding motility-associated protein GldE [Sodaliphilus sp.]|nr:gliding motility-associated protein GldE [Sodaliphilus sp.]
MDPDPLSCILAMLCSAQSIELNLPTAGSVLAIVVALAGLLLSAFNSGSEIACFSLKQDDIDSIDDEQKQEKLKGLLAESEKLLATILVGNNLINVMVVVVLNFAMNQIFVFNSPVASFVVQTVILTFLILLFGEVMPKLYASNNNVKFALAAYGGLRFMMSLFAPITKIMVKSSYIVDKVVSKRADNISMDDLSKALEASDVTAGDEKDILQGILTFGDKTVAEIMRPRVDVVDVDYDAKFEDVVKTVIDNGYSRMPVYDETPDNIKGILYAKDLLPYIGKRDNNFRWQNLLRTAYFVPETRMIDDLLEDFRKKKIHLAVVVDEFGCTQGIATMEDVLEEIVGDIDDEYDTEESFYSKLNETTYVFDGKTQLNDFYRVTGMTEEDFDSDVLEDAETLAGLLLNIKGNFLKVNEMVCYGKCEFTVLEVDKYRIAKIKLRIMPDTEGEKSK